MVTEVGNLMLYWKSRAQLAELKVEVMKRVLRELHIQGFISNKTASQFLEVLEAESVSALNAL